MDYTNEKHLTAQLRKGDEKAYDFLMDTYYGELLSYAHMLAKDVDVAQDIVQNMYVKMWIRRKKLEIRQSMKNYLYRSVFNEFVNHTRKKSKFTNLEKKYLESLEAVTEGENVDLEQLMALVNKEIEKLPKKCKRIFLLNKKEGLTYPEIAEHLDISIKTIEGHMTRAYKALNESLKDKINLFLILHLWKRYQTQHSREKNDIAGNSPMD